MKNCEECELVSENIKLKLIVEGLQQKIDIMKRTNQKVFDTLITAVKKKKHE